MNIITTKPFDLDTFKMGMFIIHKGENSFFNRQIMKEQIKENFAYWKTQYTHVGCSIGGPYSLDAVYPMSGVFDIRKSFKGKYIMLVRVKGYSTEVYKKFAVWSATKCNLKYGWFSLIYFKMEKIFKNRNILANISHPFCSFKEGWAIQRELIGFWNKPVENLMPADFLNEDLFEYVWEGVIP